MAYTHQAKVNRVSFDETHKFAGLEMRTRGMNFRDLADIVGSLSAAGLQATLTPNAAPDQAEAMLTELVTMMETLRAKFAQHLIGWNMRYSNENDEESDVPPTAEGLALVDDETLLELVGEWITAISSPAPSLGKDYGSGVIYPEPSIPMAPLSASHTS